MTKKEAAQVKDALLSARIAWMVLMPGSNFMQSHEDAAKSHNKAMNICKKYEKQKKKRRK